MLVSEIMSKEPIVAEVPGTREDAIRLLLEHSVSGVPVVKDGTRTLAGVLTRSDLLKRPHEEQLALIMTSHPFTVAPGDTVEDAAELFLNHRIHTLPVVEDGHLVGVTSPSDILRVITSRNGQTVRDLGVEPATPVHASAPIRVAWEIMKLSRQNALPILDDQARLAGIVADSDLFRSNRISSNRGNGAGDGNGWAWGPASALITHAPDTQLALPQDPVSTVMVRDVQTVFEGASVSDAARKLVKFGISQLPVLDANDRLRGLVTDIGLMRAILSHEDYLVTRA